MASLEAELERAGIIDAGAQRAVCELVRRREAQARRSAVEDLRTQAGVEDVAANGVGGAGVEPWTRGFFDDRVEIHCPFHSQPRPSSIGRGDNQNLVNKMLSGVGYGMHLKDEQLSGAAIRVIIDNAVQIHMAVHRVVVEDPEGFQPVKAKGRPKVKLQKVWSEFTKMVDVVQDPKKGKGHWTVVRKQGPPPSQRSSSKGATVRRAASEQPGRYSRPRPREVRRSMRGREQVVSLDSCAQAAVRSTATAPARVAPRPLSSGPPAPEQPREPAQPQPAPPAPAPEQAQPPWWSDRAPAASSEELPRQGHGGQSLGGGLHGGSGSGRGLGGGAYGASGSPLGAAGAGSGGLAGGYGGYGGGGYGGYGGYGGGGSGGGYGGSYNGNLSSSLSASLSAGASLGAGGFGGCGGGGYGGGYGASLPSSLGGSLNGSYAVGGYSSGRYGGGGGGGGGGGYGGSGYSRGGRSASPAGLVGGREPRGADGRAQSNAKLSASLAELTAMLKEAQIIGSGSGGDSPGRRTPPRR